MLIAEDEDSLRTVSAAACCATVTGYFRRLNGEDALRMWSAHRDEIDLLFTDMVMPGEMTGWELAVRLRADKPGLKVIICTGYSQESALQELDAGTRMALLRKPFDVARLLQAVRQCLEFRLKPRRLARGGPRHPPNPPISLTGILSRESSGLFPQGKGGASPGDGQLPPQSWQDVRSSRGWKWDSTLP